MEVLTQVTSKTNGLERAHAALTDNLMKKYFSCFSNQYFYIHFLEFRQSVCLSVHLPYSLNCWLSFL